MHWLWALELGSQFHFFFFFGFVIDAPKFDDFCYFLSEFIYNLLRIIGVEGPAPEKSSTFFFLWSVFIDFGMQQRLEMVLLRNLRSNSCKHSFFLIAVLANVTLISCNIVFLEWVFLNFLIHTANFLHLVPISSLVFHSDLIKFFPNNLAFLDHLVF